MMKNINKKHILIIEDDRDILEVLTDLLESEGYAVSSANNGLEAIMVLESAKYLPHLMLVDLMMPIMNGFQFRDFQKNDSRFNHIPVVFMSADGHNEARRDLIGSLMFMKKPLALDEVLDTIYSHTLASA